MEISSDLQRKALQIFEDAISLSGESRRDFVADSCGGDTQLLTEVESLLAHHREEHALISNDGHFELLEEIARGGMSVIYRARDANLKRDVALKVLEESRINPDMLRRFAFEAHLSATMEHPGIPSAYRLGTLIDGRPYFAMKLVEGQTMRAVLDGGTATQRQLLDMLAQVADTVACAHERNIVHNDLKPENVMIGKFKEVQVMDWGLAEEVESDDNTPRDVLGTPAYMPPEFNRSTYSDVFALGSMLCEILTGLPAYDCESSKEAYEMAVAAELEPALLRLRKSQSPSELLLLAEQCLQVDPESRPSATHIVKVINQYFDDLAISAEKSKRLVQLVVAASASLLVIAAVTVVSLILIGQAREREKRIRAESQRAIVDAEQRELQMRSDAIDQFYYRAHDIFRSGAGKNPEVVIPMLEAAVEFDPEDLNSWDLLAYAYTRNGQYDKAGKAWKKTQELGQIVNTEMYAIYLEATGKSDESLDFLQDMVRNGKDPNPFIAENSQHPLVMQLFKRQRYVEAVEIFSMPFEHRESRDLTDIRVQAAISALLASQGRGVDAGELTEQQRTSMRRQGLEWLHTALKDQLAGKPHAKETLFKIRLAKQNESLGNWIDAQFEPEEQHQWDAFWADVELAKHQQLHQLPSVESGWELVRPSHMTSANRAQLTLEDDMSIFVTGPRVIADTYTIHTDLKAAEVRQLALVLPADERLPSRGPGRHHTGNYHLAEITVLSGDQPVPLTLLDYSYEWTGREATNAIDGNTNTDWHVWGQIGVSHFITLGLDAESDGNLTVQLKHGNENIGATIGYFRLLVRSDLKVTK